MPRRRFLIIFAPPGYKELGAACPARAGHRLDAAQKSERGGRRGRPFPYRAIYPLGYHQIPRGAASWRLGQLRLLHAAIGTEYQGLFSSLCLAALGRPAVCLMDIAERILSGVGSAPGLPVQRPLAHSAAGPQVLPGGDKWLRVLRYLLRRY